jgi:hypothetical protein
VCVCLREREGARERESESCACVCVRVCVCVWKPARNTPDHGDWKPGGGRRAQEQEHACEHKLHLYICQFSSRRHAKETVFEAIFPSFLCPSFYSSPFLQSTFTRHHALYLLSERQTMRPAHTHVPATLLQKVSSPKLARILRNGRNSLRICPKLARVLGNSWKCFTGLLDGNVKRGRDERERRERETRERDERER